MANDLSKIAKQLEKHKTVQDATKYVNKKIIEQHNKQEKNKATGINKTNYEEELNKN